MGHFAYKLQNIIMGQTPKYHTTKDVFKHLHLFSIYIKGYNGTGS